MLRALSQLLGGTELKSVITTPLFFGERLSGLFVFRFMLSRILDEEERQLMHMLASRAILAIELARLSKKTQAAAIFEERHRFAREIHDGIA